MESKSNSNGGSQQWWRWSSGKSGAIASSSSSSPAASTANNDHAFASTFHAAAAVLIPSSSPSSPPSSSSENSLRWQKRSSVASSSSRAVVTPVKDTTASEQSAANGTWSTSPSSSRSSFASPSSSGNSSSLSSSLSSSSSSGSSSPPMPMFFASSSANMISAHGLPATSTRKKLSSTSSFLRATSSSSNASLLGKKKPAATVASSPFASTMAATTASPFAASSTASFSMSRASTTAPTTTTKQPDIVWSAAPTKRRVKKASKTPVASRRASLYAPHAIRPIADRDARAAFSSSSARVVAAAAQPVPLRFASSRGVAPMQALFASAGPTRTVSPRDRTTSSSSPSAASTASTSSSSYATSPFALPRDPLATCARAVLQDCIMKRRMERSSNMRKRNIDACVTTDGGNNMKTGVYFKASDCGRYSSSSSSSDEELSQLSSMERSCTSIDKVGDDDDGDDMLSKEELYRRDLMFGDNGWSSSSQDYECDSPCLDEEKGLPVEIRYQLPLALGTANEIDKECTICQLRYGIGDHIVTLPCQHFFHACCVDKWLWNHTSCPLCRTDVTLDMETDAALHPPKHNFTACSQFDQETIRRKMRSSSQRASFRPVVPVDDDQLTSLDEQLASLSVHEATQQTFLVCPKPQRQYSSK